MPQKVIETISGVLGIVQIVASLAVFPAIGFAFDIEQRLSRIEGALKVYLEKNPSR